jgi:hypothetical protein
MNIKIHVVIITTKVLPENSVDDADVGLLFGDEIGDEAGDEADGDEADGDGTEGDLAEGDV